MGVCQENIGGFLAVTSKADLRRKISLLTIYSYGQHVYAVGVYTGYLGGQKLFGLGSDGSDEGKYGARLIIQRDIENYKDWYWCEASGAVEHLFNKYGGFGIPALYAAEILRRKNVEIVDEYHYKRPLGPDRETYTKEIFGFRDQGIYDKVIEYLQKETNNTVGYMNEENEKLNEATDDENEKLKNNVELAYHTIGAISELTNEMQTSELIPSQVKALQQSIKTLKEYSDDSRVEGAIELGEYMLNTYTMLIPKRF